MQRLGRTGSMIDGPDAARKPCLRRRCERQSWTQDNHLWCQAAVWCDELTLCVIARIGGSRSESIFSCAQSRRNNDDGDGRVFDVPRYCELEPLGVWVDTSDGRKERTHVVESLNIVGDDEAHELCRI